MLWPDAPEKAVLPEDDAGEHFAVVAGFGDGSAPVSVVSLFVDGRSAQFRKFATDAGFRKLGLGSRLLAHVVDVARRRGVASLWCNARASQEGFYARRGLLRDGDCFTRSGVEYVRMAMSL